MTGSGRLAHSRMARPWLVRADISRFNWALAGTSARAAAKARMLVRMKQLRAGSRIRTTLAA